MSSWRRNALGGVLLSFAIVLNGCSGRDSSAVEKKEPPAVPVIVAPVVQKIVPLRLQAIGNVEPYATVAVKARVDGQIVKVFFSDGQEVVQGQTLFQLDARPFEALLKQSEAALLRDKAQLAHARAQEERYKDLLHKGFVSQDAYAQFRTNVDTAQATVAADEAAVENVRLQREYTTIRSPINGRTGKVMIQLGNLVKANDTNPLVVINQVVPVYVSFAVPEQYLETIRGYMAKAKLPVEALIGDTRSAAANGELAFIDNTVDTATGTVRLRARFPNQDKILWPGQFVTAVLTFGEQKNAIVVPSQAVQTGPDGDFVFIISPGSTAEVRKVAVERTEGGQTVIAKGLAPGEQVVTTGQVRLTAGTRVKAATAPGDT